MTKSARKIYALLLGLQIYSALGENPLPTLGQSTNADDFEENSQGNRFFKSTSQAMILTTTPPSMIMPTSTVSKSIITSSTSLPRVTSEDEKEDQMDISTTTSETLVKSQNSPTTISKKESTTRKSSENEENESKAQSTQRPIVTQEKVTQDSTMGTIEVHANSDSIESSIESIVSSSEDLFVSTTSLFEATTSTKQVDLSVANVDIEPTKVADLDTEKPESSSVNVPFLAPKVSSAAAASRPQNQPRVAPANIEALDKMVVGEPGMQIINKTEKKTRQSDQDSQLPGVNDLLNGLLNVVGEGLTFATNFVKEENQRKKEAAEKLALEKEKELLLQSSISAVPALLPGRVNNRGPPRFTEIPFEAIPLEILNSQRPGQKPVQIPQRPFHTRIKITKTKLPPFASGIPLPEVLIPGFEMPTTPSTTTTTIPDGSATEGGKLENEVQVQPKRNATSEIRFPTLSSTVKTPPKIDLADLVKLQNTKNNGGNDVDLKLLQPSKTIKDQETTTIYATASNILPKWPPRRRPIPGKIEPTRRPPPRPQNNQIRTPPLRPQRPYPRPPPPAIRPPLAKPQNEPEVLFSGQAFDLQPSRQPLPSRPEVFDLTVSVQQNFGGGANKPSLMNQNDVIITKATAGGDQFVTIDGKKTYFDVGPTRMPNFATPPPANRPQPPQNLGNNNRYQPEEPVSQPIMNRPSYVDKLVPTRRPPAPPIRIDTCIVGDDTTCQIDKHEVCRTHLGVSSCDCKPGYGRSSHRKSCKKTIRLMMSLQVDRIKQRQVRWDRQSYTNPNSENYRTLEDEAIYAINTAMALTSLSNAYLSSDVNRFFNLNGKVTINATLLFLENSYTSSVVVKRDIQKKLLEVIQARNNNVGNGNLYVDSQLNPIPGVADVNECSEPELHDCDAQARCINRFGSFDCVCLPGYGDRFADDPQKAGRYCESCSADYCYGRGTCLIKEGDQKECECKGNYYGNQCEIDGEVVAVAVGASVAAVVIIILTLTCLCLWSRRWKREQRKAEIMRGFPPTYLNANPNPHLAATYMANLNKAAAYAAAVSANRHHSLMTPVYHQNQAMATSHEDLTAEGRMRVQQQQTKASVDPYNQNIYAPKNKTRHYAEIGFKNGVFTNPANRKPQRSPSRRRKQDEEASLRRKPSVRSTRSYRIMDDTEELAADVTRSSFRSTRRHQFPDLIQHHGQQYYNDGHLQRPPTRFSRY